MDVDGHGSDIVILWFDGLSSFERARCRKVILSRPMIGRRNAVGPTHLFRAFLTRLKISLKIGFQKLPQN